jgi:hypothetical protein
MSKTAIENKLTGLEFELSQKKKRGKTGKTQTGPLFFL